MLQHYEHPVLHSGEKYRFFLLLFFTPETVFDV
jgi:hypothetical protein